MFDAFQVLTLLLVAIAMTTALAHALEFPGKLRLGRDAYVAVQPIYYPGFTLAGLIGEAGGLLATLLMTLLTWGSAGFQLALAGFLAMVVMHGIYWVFTHPVNNFWLAETEIGKAGSGFFSLAGKGKAHPEDWKKLRDRWEYSHVARAVFATLAFLFLAILAVY